MMIASRSGGGGRNRTAAVIAVAGVSFALTVMLLTISITSGFKNEITRKLEGFMPQISVNGAYDYADGDQADYIRADQQLTGTVGSVLSGAQCWLAMRHPGILKTPDDYAPLIFTGYGAGRDTTFETSNIIDGEFPDYARDGQEKKIVISRSIAERMGLGPGDRVMSCFFIDEHIRARKLEVAGIYESNFADYDNTVCYASIYLLQQLCGVDSLTGTSYEIVQEHKDDIKQAANSLQERFLDDAAAKGTGEVPVVDNITHTGAMYLNWLDLLDTNVTVIFVLMCCVAGCTLVSGLFILILNNVRAIGILRSLGLSNRSVSRIFVYMTMRLAGIGMLIGNIFALTLIWIQSACHIVPLNPEMYYLSHVPVEIDIIDILAVNLGAVVLSWAIVVMPAKLTSKVSPARTMRYD